MFLVGLRDLLAAIVLVRLLRFVSTPLLRHLGFYQYYSPLLLSVRVPGARQLHLGTSFDFLRASERSPRRSLCQLVCGLLAICRAVETGALQDSTVFVGTTYFLREETLLRLGLRARRPGVLQLAAAIAAYLEVCLLHSLAKRALRPVPLARLRQIRFTGRELLERRAVLEKLRQALLQRGEKGGKTASRAPLAA